jgi:hypothetical protein
MVETDTEYWDYVQTCIHRTTDVITPSHMFYSANIQDTKDILELKKSLYLIHY